ncbi:hypothetical protein ACHAXA_011077 [Cyclostephanos tholiformis]|uniref:Uncharacterized protein n=1 Tax=Cyclostephanos tholiformis TaxID=382380 RepID=A0ABD3R6Z7_9STRA
MSPGFNSVTNIPPTPISPPPVVASPATTPKRTISTSKLNGLVGLLSRCPSPSRYANAALLGKDDDYDGGERGRRDVRGSAGVIVGGDDIDNDEQSSDDGPLNVDYLKNYSIEYREDEEFDNLGDGGGGGGRNRYGGGGGGSRRMLPMDRIRPTLGQNLAKLDLCGCKCSLFDLSGAEKMRPMWERYYQDADAIIYVVDGAETSFSKLYQSRLAFERMCQNEAVRERARSGLPVMVFVNRLDAAYAEYEAGMEMAMGSRKDDNDDVEGGTRNGLRSSWNLDEEDDFVGGAGTRLRPTEDGKNSDADAMITSRVVDFEDLVALFGFPRPGRDLRNCTAAADRGNLFLFGGSAKSGEGVRAAMEYLVAHAKSYHLAMNAWR